MDLWRTVLWRSTRPSRNTTKNRCPFQDRGLEWKQEVKRYRNNRQVWPWSTKRSRERPRKYAGHRVLPRKHTGHRKHPLPTTQEPTLHMNITRGLIQKSNWLYSLQPKMEKLYTVSKNKIWSWLWLRSWAHYCKIQVYAEESRENH